MLFKPKKYPHGRHLYKTNPSFPQFRVFGVVRGLSAIASCDGGLKIPPVFLLCSLRSLRLKVFFTKRTHFSSPLATRQSNPVKASQTRIFFERRFHFLKIRQLTTDNRRLPLYLVMMNKEHIAEILTEIATLLELKGENPFKSRAYVNAARAVEALRGPLDKIFVPEPEEHVKGIGESIHQKICELVATEKLAYYDELKASVPPGLVEMLSIPGMGPKKVKAVHDKLGIETVEQLENACTQGKVAELDGFGDKTQAKIIEGINFRKKYAARHHLSDALAAAEPILDNLRAHPDVIRCSMAGSLRRSKEI